MQRIVLLLFITLSFALQLFAQQSNIGNPPDIARVVPFGGSSPDRIQEMVSDSEGNIYICGYNSGIMNFSGTSIETTAAEEGFIIKMDPDKNIIWKKQFGESFGTFVHVKFIDIDGEDNIYLTGDFNSDHLSLGDQSHPRTGISDVFAAKMDKNGNFLWSVAHGKTSQTTKAGNIKYSSGYSFITTDQSLLKLDDNGNILWEKSYPGISQIGVSDSDILITGIFRNSITFDNGESLNSFGYRGIYLVSMNLEGEINAIEGFDCLLYVSDFSSIFSDDHNRFYVSGYFYDKIELGNTVIEGDRFEKTAVIMKFDKELNLLWHMKPDQPSNEITSAMVVNGTYLFSGSYASTISFQSNSLSGNKAFILEIDSASNINSFNNLAEPGSCMSAIDNATILSGNKDFNFFISKYDNNLNLLWSTASSGDGGSVGSAFINHVDSEGNQIMQLDYSGCIGTANINTSGKGTALVKLNSDGQLVWYKNFIGKSIEGIATLSDDEGNVYCHGIFSGDFDFGSTGFTNSTGKSLYFAKFDPEGNEIFFNEYKCTGNISKVGEIAIDKEKNIILTGSFYKEITFGSHTFTIPDLPGYNNGFLVKTDPLGEIIWARHILSQGKSEARSLDIDSNNNIYLSGSFSIKALTLDTVSISPNDNGGFPTAFILKLGTEGNAIWGKKASTDSYYTKIHTLSVSPDGSAYVNGVMWDIMGKSSIVSFGNLDLDADSSRFGEQFIVKYGPEGQEKWAKKISASIFSWPVYSSSLDEDENLYLGGNFEGNLEIDSDVNIQSSNSSSDQIIMKYDSLGGLEWLKTISGDHLENQYSGVFSINTVSEDNLILSGNIKPGIHSFDHINIANSTQVAYTAAIGNNFEKDFDGDGIPDHLDNDDDGDGYSDNEDPYPLDPNLPGVFVKPDFGKNIKVFPNPAQDKIHIHYPNETILSIRLYNLNGALVKIDEPYDHFARLDISSLPGGYYVVQVYAERRTFKRMIMINR